MLQPAYYHPECPGTSQISEFSEGLWTLRKASERSSNKQVRKSLANMGSREMMVPRMPFQLEQSVVRHQG